MPMALVERFYQGKTPHICCCMHALASIWCVLLLAFIFFSKKLMSTKARIFVKRKKSGEIDWFISPIPSISNIFACIEQEKKEFSNISNNNNDAIIGYEEEKRSCETAYASLTMFYDDECIEQSTQLSINIIHLAEEVMMNELNCHSFFFTSSYLEARKHVDCLFYPSNK